jgi:hypothetical protein
LRNIKGLGGKTSSQCSERVVSFLTLARQVFIAADDGIRCQNWTRSLPFSLPKRARLEAPPFLGALGYSTIAKF